MKNPCKNCRKRTPTCHGECEEYLIFFRSRREENKRRRDAKRMEFDATFHYKKRR